MRTRLFACVTAHHQIMDEDHCNPLVPGPFEPLYDDEPGQLTVALEYRYCCRMNATSRSGGHHFTSNPGRGLGSSISLHAMPRFELVAMCNSIVRQTSHFSLTLPFS